MTTIDGVATLVRDILKRNMHSTDYYRREYKWESRQLTDQVAGAAS